MTTSNAFYQTIRENELDRNGFQSNHYLEKPLPANKDAEQSVLAGVLLDNKLMNQVLAFIKADDFYYPDYRHLFIAMERIYKQGDEINAVTISESLKVDGRSIENYGGSMYIANLIAGFPRVKSLEPSLKIIKAKSLSRTILKTCQVVQSSLLEEDEDNVKILSEFIRTLIALQNETGLSSRSISEIVVEAKDLLTTWQKGNESVSGIKTGIPELDGNLKMKGIALGELTLIAARPSIGKTALLTQISMNAVRLNVPTLFLTLEMTILRLVLRMLPPISGISNIAINPMTVQNDEQSFNSLLNALDSIKDLPLYFDRSFDLSQLIATAELFIQTKGVKLIVFDYLTLIKNMSSRSFGNRDVEVGLITNELKELGVRTNTAILGAAQLNRKSEEDARRPRLDDLRESGFIEQAADVVLFPYDAHAKDHRKNLELIKDEMLIDLYCAKQRDGRRYWTVYLDYDKNKQIMTSAEMRGESPVQAKPEPIPEQVDEEIPDF